MRKPLLVEVGEHLFSMGRIAKAQCHLHSGGRFFRKAKVQLTQRL